MIEPNCRGEIRCEIIAVIDPLYSTKNLNCDAKSWIRTRLLRTLYERSSLLLLHRISSIERIKGENCCATDENI